MVKKTKQRRKPKAVKRKPKRREVNIATEQVFAHLVNVVDDAVQAAFEKRNGMIKSFRPPRPKRIEEYTDEELEHAIEAARSMVPGWWTIMRGVDSFLERRKRRQKGELQ